MSQDIVIKDNFFQPPVSTFRSVTRALHVTWALFFFIFKFRSSCSEMFLKIGVLKNFANLKGKHLCWSLFLIMLQVLCLRLFQTETPTQVFSCEICEIFKEHLFLQNNSGGCFYKLVLLPFCSVLVILLDFLAIEKWCEKNVRPNCFVIWGLGMEEIGTSDNCIRRTCSIWKGVSPNSTWNLSQFKQLKSLLTPALKTWSILICLICLIFLKTAENLGGFEAN